MRSLVGVCSEETLAPDQVHCNFSGLRALRPYQQLASYKHATIRPRPLLNNTDTTSPASTPAEVAERDLSSSLSPSCRSITLGWNIPLARPRPPFLTLPRRERSFSPPCLQPRKHPANETDMKRFSMVFNIVAEAVEHRAGGLLAGWEW